MLSPVAQAALERLNTLHQCWRAVNDLMIPENDLHQVNRDALAVLLDFLQRESEAATEGFTQAIRAL